MKRSELKQIIREVIEESANKNIIDIDGIFQAIKDEGLVEKYQEHFSDLNKTPRFVSNGTSLTMSNQTKFKTVDGKQYFISQQIFIYEKNINTLEIQISEIITIDTKVTSQYKDVKQFKNVGDTSVVSVNKDKIMTLIRDAFDDFSMAFKGIVIEDSKSTKNTNRPLVKESVEIQIDKIIEAYRNFDRYQRADFLYGMAGPRNVGFRQSVMSALVGRLVPKTQCGIHAIEAELNKAIEQ